MKLLDRRFLNISIAVQGIANEPAANPAVGTQYIVGANGSGAFAGIAPNSIARFNGSSWEFISPKQGELEVLNLENGKILSFNGSAWVSVASMGASSILPVDGIVDFFRQDSVTDEYLPGQFGIYWSDNYGQYTFCSKTYKYNSDPSSCELSSTTIQNGQRFAAALNSKVFTIANRQTKASVTEETLSDGDLVFNLADNSFYAYSATAHRLLKLGSTILSVDELVDYSVKGLSDPLSAGLSIGSSVIDWQSGSIYSISKTDNFSTSDSISGEHDIIIGKSFVARNDANFNSPVLIHILSDNSAGQGQTFQNGSLYNTYSRISVIPDGAIIFNKADCSTYVFDAVNNSFSQFGGSTVTEAHVLSAAEALAKSFSLAHSIAAGQEDNIICSVSGIMQVPNIDFTASGQTISWAEKGLDSIVLDEGDTFIVHYIRR